MMAVVLSAKVLVLANEWSARVFLPAPQSIRKHPPSLITHRSSAGFRDDFQNLVRPKQGCHLRSRDALCFSNQMATMSRISTRRPMMITVVEIVTVDWPPARPSVTARA